MKIQFVNQVDLNGRKMSMFWWKCERNSKLLQNTKVETNYL